MQYIDKDGNRHNIPLHSIQPKISPDADNMLYESANGLKVDEISGGGNSSITYGYLNPVDGEFYEDHTFKTKLDHNNKDTYVDMTTHAMWKPYVWDELHSIYRSIGSGQGMGSATFVSMLQEQYDILPDEEKQDGNFAYFVQDENDGAEAIVADMLAEQLAEKMTEEITKKVADTLYPIGSYAFGVMPSIGTWEEVEGDRALWLKNTAADGTEIEQALPNINGAIRFNSQGSFISSEAGSYSKGALRTGNTLEYTLVTSGTTNPWVKNSNGRELVIDANKSNSIYQDNANVQPNAYVMKVFKRIA